MSTLKYYTYPGYGEQAKKNYKYSQAVRVPPNRVECSGQGGWNPETSEMLPTWQAQIDQAFKNVELTLTNAEVANGWKSVFSVRSYHVGEIKQETMDAMVKNMRHWSPDHEPIWTMISVPYLALPGMLVEIEVVAFDEEGGK